MKNILKLLLYGSIMVMMLNSCEEVPTYPRYTLDTITHIPDTLKVEHRTWITETVRAASQHMTGGDYEDVDQTIIQAERTANRLFGVEVIGLRKEINDNYYDDLQLVPSQLTPKELEILNNLK